MTKTMGAQKNLILGSTDFTRHSPLFCEMNDKELIKYTRNDSPRGRLLLALGQYLQHTNVYDRIFVYITNQASGIYLNGTFGGIIGKVNPSEVDIDVTSLLCEDITMETVNISYPFKINDFTFVTFKPKYKP